MKPITSVSLDLLRSLAAMMVFGYHVSLPWFFPAMKISAAAGHDAVTVFFVLSGYVIAYSTRSKRGSALSYSLARLSRLYSVVLPALLLTAILFFCGRAIRGEFYAQFDRGMEGFRLILCTFFLQEFWFLSASPPSNSPLWSLGYEFWYYVVFGIAIYGWDRRAGRWLMCGCLLLIGPKILLLLPVWLFGVAAFSAGQSFKIDRMIATCGCVLGLIAGTVLLLSGWRSPEALGSPPLYYSAWFLSDYCGGLILASLIFFCDQLLSSRDPFPSLTVKIRNTANLSFPLYLYHYPLLVCFAAFVPFDHSGWLQALAVMCLVLTSVFALGISAEGLRVVIHRSMARLTSTLN